MSLVTTVLDIQPRVSSGGDGRSNDDIVYELADSILEKLMDKLDIEQANAELFKVRDTIFFPTTLHVVFLIISCTNLLSLLKMDFIKPSSNSG